MLGYIAREGSRSWTGCSVAELADPTGQEVAQPDFFQIWLSRNDCLQGSPEDVGRLLGELGRVSVFHLKGKICLGVMEADQVVIEPAVPVSPTVPKWCLLSAQAAV